MSHHGVDSASLAVSGSGVTLNQATPTRTERRRINLISQKDFGLII